MAAKIANGRPFSGPPKGASVHETHIAHMLGYGPLGKMTL